MDGGTVLLYSLNATRTATIRTILRTPEHECVAVGSEGEVLDLVRKGVGRAIVIGVIGELSESAAFAAALRVASPGIAILYAQVMGKPITPAGPTPASGNAISDLIIGSSTAICRMRNYVAKLAIMDCNVVVTGETGTGKELVAQALHLRSRRHGSRMVAINCAAIPDSLFESEMFGHERGAFSGAVETRIGKLQLAEGGTVFLDEIEELSPMGQAKLLRAIETREVEKLGGSSAKRIDVRVVAAGNQDFVQLMERGRFRRDLYYRLAVTMIEVPPLRERIEDVPMLARHFVDKVNRAFGLCLGVVNADALAVLQEHRWPGNVRELRNVIEAIGVEKQAGNIARADLPPWFLPKRSTVSAGPPEERYRLIRALENTGWIKSRAARELNCSRMTVYRRMNKFQVQGGARSTTSLSDE